MARGLANGPGEVKHATRCRRLGSEFPDSRCARSILSPGSSPGQAPTLPPKGEVLFPLPPGEGRLSTDPPRRPEYSSLGRHADFPPSPFDLSTGSRSCKLRDRGEGKNGQTLDYGCFLMVAPEFLRMTSETRLASPWSPNERACRNWADSIRMSAASCGSSSSARRASVSIAAPIFVVAAGTLPSARAATASCNNFWTASMPGLDRGPSATASSGRRVSSACSDSG